MSSDVSLTMSRAAAGLQGSRSRNDFNELPRDDELSGPVETQREFVNHLSSVLRGAVHGGHSGGLLGAGVLLHGIVDG